MDQIAALQPRMVDHLPAVGLRRIPVDLALFHRQPHRRAALVAGDQPEPRTDHVVHQRGHRIGVRRLADRAQDDLRTPRSVHRRGRREIFAHRHRIDALAPAAEPCQFRGIVGGLVEPKRHPQRNAGAGRKDHRSVFRRDVVAPVERDHAAGARHVLRDDCRLAGNVPAHVPGEDDGERRIEAACLEPDDDVDRLARVELRHLVRARRLERQYERDREAGEPCRRRFRLHAHAPFVRLPSMPRCPRIAPAKPQNVYLRSAWPRIRRKHHFLKVPVSLASVARQCRSPASLCDRTRPEAGTPLRTTRFPSPASSCRSSSSAERPRTSHRLRWPRRESDRSRISLRPRP